MFIIWRLKVNRHDKLGIILVQLYTSILSSTCEVILLFCCLKFVCTTSIINHVLDNGQLVLPITMATFRNDEQLQPPMRNNNQHAQEQMRTTWVMIVVWSEDEYYLIVLSLESYFRRWIISGISSSSSSSFTLSLRSHSLRLRQASARPVEVPRPCRPPRLPRPDFGRRMTP